MIRSGTIKQIVEEKGHAGFQRFLTDMLEGRVSENGVQQKLRPQDFSLRALWEGLVGPVDETLAVGYGRMGYIEQNFQEEVSTSSFASATGQLIGAQVIEGYNSVPAVGDRLVTNMPSNLRGERIVGFTHNQGPKTVLEGESYQDSTFADKYVTTVESKKGRLLSVTEEAVTLDQTGQALMRAARLGEETRAERERVIIRGVADVASSDPVYRPSGTSEQLYVAGNNNLLSTATPLVDWTDIQEVMAFHATNVTDDRETDDANGGRPILWRPRQILVAMENAGTAARIASATMVGTAPGSTTTAAMETANPISILTGGNLEVLASPYLDEAEGADQWDDASDWLIGDFPKQFVWKEIWPLQVFRAGADDPERLERDVVARFKVRYFGGINAIDERHVVKVNAV